MLTPNSTAVRSKVRALRRERGQGMTEYIIIVALIAVACIGIVTLFGNNIRALFSDSARALAGEETVANSGDNGSVGATPPGP